MLFEGGRTVGVELADGTRFFADVVVSAADLRHIVEHLLGGKFREPQVEELFREMPLMPPGRLVTIGLKGAFPEEAASTSYELPAEVTIAGAWLRWLAVRSLNFDASLSPAAAGARTHDRQGALGRQDGPGRGADDLQDGGPAVDHHHEPDTRR